MFVKVLKLLIIAALTVFLVRSAKDFRRYRQISRM